MTVESVILNQMELVCGSQRVTVINPNNNCVTLPLMARDYKGFGNQKMNGVMKWK